MFFTDKQRLDRKVTHAFNTVYVNHVKKRASSFNTFYLTDLMDNVYYYYFKNELHISLFWALFRRKSIGSEKINQRVERTRK